MAGNLNIWDLLVKVSGDSSSFRDDVQKDIATLDELFAALKNAAVSINLDDGDAEQKLRDFKLKLDALRDATETIHLDDAKAKDEIDRFKLKLDELRNQTVDINVSDADAKTKIDDIKLKLDEIRNPDVKVNLDNVDLEAQVEEAKLELDTLPNEKDVKVNIDNTGLELQVEEARLELDMIPDEKTVHVNVDGPGVGGGGGGATGAAAAAGRGGTLLPWLIAGLAPLVPAVGAPTLANGMGLLSSLLAGGAGTAGLAAVATPDIKGLITDQQNLKKAVDAVNAAEQKVQGAKTYQQWLTATQGLTMAQNALEKAQDGVGASEQRAITALSSFESFWKSFTDSFKPAVFNMFTNGLQMAQQLLTDMRPAITAAAGAFAQLLDGASKALQAPFWRSFFQYLGGEAKGSILSIGTSLGNLVKGVAALMMAFEPMAKSMNQGLVNLTQRFADWASHLSATEGFKQFLDYARENGPKVMEVLGQLFSLIGKVLVILAPLGSTMLTVVADILKLVNALLSSNSIIRLFIDYVIQVADQILNISGAIVGFVARLGILNSTFKSVNEAWNFMKTVAGEVWSYILGQTQSAVQGIEQGFQNLIGALTGAWNTIRNAVSQGAHNAWNAMTSVFDGLKGYFTNLWTEAEQWGANVIHMFAQGIRNATSEVGQAVQNVASNITHWLGFHSPSAGLPDSDQWAPNFVKMFANGLTAGIPLVNDALSKVMVPPNVSSMIQQAGQRLGSVAASAAHQASNTFHSHVHINAPVYGVDDLQGAINEGWNANMQQWMGNLKATARAMGVSS